LAATASPPTPPDPAAPPSPASEAAADPAPLPAAQLLMAMILAWLVPGLGHVYLKRTLRGLVFFVLIVLTIAIGCNLSGNLYRPVQGQPLTYMATYGSMGMGLGYFALRYGLHYEGQQEAAGFEYGTAFLLTAGLMNLLLVLDALDIASGKKE
jgi:hypothetical protein